MKFKVIFAALALSISGLVGCARFDYKTLPSEWTQLEETKGDYYLIDEANTLSIRNGKLGCYQYVNGVRTLCEFKIIGSKKIGKTVKLRLRDSFFYRKDLDAKMVWVDKDHGVAVWQIDGRDDDSYKPISIGYAGKPLLGYTEGVFISNDHLADLTSAGRLAKTGPDGENIDSLMAAFVPQVRPDEDLKYGETYVDEFEYVEYNCDYDYCFLAVCKPGGDDVIHLYEDWDGDIDNLSCGDRLRIYWHIGLAWQAGDGDTPYLNEYATKVEKIADGPVSRFRAAHPDSLRYVHPNGWDPTEEEERSARERYTAPYYYGVAEFYVATSQRSEVAALRNDPASEICYSVNENDDQDFFSRFDIWNGNATGEVPEITAAFRIDTNEDSESLTLYELDPATGNFTKISTY